MLQNVISRRRLIEAVGLAGASMVTGNNKAVADVVFGRSVIVQTRQGALRGQEAGATLVFRGIPYAEPPCGTLRFRRPQPPRSWVGIRDALVFGQQSEQKELDPKEDPAAWKDPSAKSEDCLYLNVWTPVEGGPGAKPVMVWFHGGAFSYGSGGSVLYDGQRLAEVGDVIVVTVNHRLNIYGYLWLGDLFPDYASDAMPGQHDLIAALHWIKENIRGFGGDPENVTIFGESGGGMKVSCLLATPSARGLFHKAIVESGSQTFVQTRAQATDVARDAFRSIGIANPKVRDLADLTVVQLNAACKATENARSMFAFQPVLDGQTLPQQPWENRAPPSATGIPMMITTTQEETAWWIPDIRKPITSEDDFRRRLAGTGFLPALSPAVEAKLFDDYRAAIPKASQMELAVAISTDAGFWHSALHQAELKVLQEAGSVYLCEFGWKTPCFGGNWAVHAVDIPLVFGIRYFGPTYDQEDGDLERAHSDPSDDRLGVSRSVMRAWSNFAHKGNPSQPGLDWPAYDTVRRATVIFDRNVKVVDDPHGDRRRLVGALPRMI